MKNIFHFLNPINWWRAHNYKRASQKYDKSSYDLELHLYSKLLSNDMLHYGYFSDPTIKPEEISIKNIEDAQVLYCQNIIDQITHTKDNILDVGCGMGGLAQMMIQNKLNVDVLTPNSNQIAYIRKTYPELKYYHSRFENIDSRNKYKTIVHSESLQYIDLDSAFEKASSIILENGKWIITDYFRITDEGINKSGHRLKDFRDKAQAHKWKITLESDITENILPTLKYINMYARRFLLPLKHFAFEKLRFKRPKLFFMTQKLRDSVDQKIEKEMASIDFLKFQKEKKYMLFVLEKTN